MNDLEHLLNAVSNNGHRVDEEAQANGEYWVEVFSDNHDEDSLIFIFKDGKLLEIE